MKIWGEVYHIKDTPKYNGNADRGLSSYKYNKATKHFHGVFKKETEFS